MLQIISKLILESCTKSTFTASHVLIAAHSESGLRGRSKFSFTVLKCICVNLLPYLSNGMLNYSKFHTMRGIPNRKDLKKISLEQQVKMTAEKETTNWFQAFSLLAGFTGSSFPKHKTSFGY